MGQLCTSILVVTLALSGGLFQLYVKPMLYSFGIVGRNVIEWKGNTKCKTIPDLQACEELVLHPSSGLLYAGCSTPEKRTKWAPSLGKLQGRELEGLPNDYFAFYDPTAQTVTRLQFENFPDAHRLAVNGIDVVPSHSSESELYVYAVNHRVPLTGDPEQTGSNSVIEIFKTYAGSTKLVHLYTVEHPLIGTPNDVVGFPDGKSFYWVDEHGAAKTGNVRSLWPFFGKSRSYVGYCHVEEGCKKAFKMKGPVVAAGIAKAANDTLYVSDGLYGGIQVLEMQMDYALTTGDRIHTEYPVDDMSLDENGALWTTGKPKALQSLHFFNNPMTSVAPSTALRITINTGLDSFYGKKYRVDEPFVDDGRIASAATTVVHDARKGVLYIHGLVSPHLAICKLD